MKIGLIDVDGHGFPNLALMKLSAWHKQHGDDVEWHFGLEPHYDRVYISKVFTEIYSKDVLDPCNADEIVRGGTGYGFGNWLPSEIEHMMPDYSLYHDLIPETRDSAYGFLTRGCPNACPFCIVSCKEGRKSRKVANLSEWWDGQKNIVLLDPNLLACRQKLSLLDQLAKSKAWVDFTQGLDARLLNEKTIEALNKVKTKRIHFAWDLMKNSKKVVKGLKLYNEFGKIKDCSRRIVYVLTNFDTTLQEDLYRIYTLRDELGYNPYVMVYDKPNAPDEIRKLQRWVNNRRIFKTVDRFDDYK